MNEAEIRKIVSEYLMNKGDKMNLSELKQKHPDLVVQLRKENYAEYLKTGGGNLEEKAAAVIAKQGRVGKPLNTKPQHEKSSEEAAADQIAGKAGIRKWQLDS